MIGCKERIFDYEYLRKFEAKIEKVSQLRRDRFTQKNEKAVSLQCNVSLTYNFHSAFSHNMLNDLGMRSRDLQFYISLVVK